MKTKRKSKITSKVGAAGGVIANTFNRSKRKDAKATEASILRAEREEKLKSIYKELTKHKKSLQAKANKSSGKDRRAYLDLRDRTIELRGRVKMVLSDLHNEPVTEETIKGTLRNYDALLRKISRKQ